MTLSLLRVVLVLAATTAQQTLCLKYPDVYRNTTSTGTYNGIKISDPYQWMENSKANSTKIFDFINAQSQLTQEYIKDCKSREIFASFKNASQDSLVYDNVQKFGNFYAYTQKRGGDEFGHWYLHPGSWEAQPIKLDYNSDNVLLSRDGELFAVFNDTEKTLTIKRIETDGTSTILETVPWENEVPTDNKFQLFRDSAEGFSYYYINKAATDDEDRFEYSVKIHKVLRNSNDSPFPEVLVLDGNTSSICVDGVQKCEIDQINLVDFPEGTGLFVVSSTHDGNQWTYANSLARPIIRKDEPLDFIIFVINKPEISRDTLNFVSYDKDNGKLYFRDTNQSPNVIIAGSFDKNGLAFEVQWNKTAFDIQNPEYDVRYAVGVGKDKILLRTTPKSRNGSQTVELRNNNGKLLVFWKSSLAQWKAFGNPRSEEILFVSTIGGEFYEIITYNVSDKFAKLITVKSQSKPMPGLELFSYAVNNQSDSESSVHLIYPATNSTKHSSRPTFIFLNAFQWMPSAAWELLPNFNSLFVIHERLPNEDVLKDTIFFWDWLKMEREVDNVISIVTSLINEDRSTPSQIFLIGLDADSALAANVINKRPDLFAGVLLSRTGKNFAPLRGASRLCPDGFYGNLCTDLNKAIFPLAYGVSPLYNVGNTAYPTVVVNLHLEMSKHFDFKSDVYGLQYLAEMQYILGGNKHPTLLTMDSKGDDDDDYHDFNQWEDFLCILEKSNNLVISTAID